MITVSEQGPRTLTRRAFLKGAALTSMAMGVAAAGCTSQSQGAQDTGTAKGTKYTTYENSAKIGIVQNTSVQETFDFVVVGAGLTGLTASMIAAEQMPKAKILLLEKLSATGGNSNFAEINAPARATTYAAARQKALDMFKASTYLKDPALLVNLYLDAAKNSAWLFTKHGVLLDETHMYYETRNGAKSMAKLTSQIKSDSAYANVEIRLNTRATALLLASDHKCTGVQALDVVSGAYKNINAKAVLLATAGMGTNLDLLSYYTGEDVQQKCLGLGAGQDGDGHLMVEQTAHGMCKGVYPTGMFHNVKGFSFSSPLGVAVALQPTNVWVNQRGERFVNEEATSVYPFIPAGKAIETEGYCFSIFGQNLKKYFETKGSDALWYYYYKTPTSLDSDLAKYKDNKYVFTAPTLEGLAQAMGVPSDTFVNTIKAYEANVTAGTGDSVLGKTAKYMVSLGDGPYYGFRIFSGIIQTNGGIRIDESCRVCDPFFTPIEGLYAGGISVHGFNVEVYSTGTSQAVALWSGSVAARHAVANLLGGTVAKNWYGDKEYDGPLADRTTANPLKQLLGNEPK